MAQARFSNAKEKRTPRSAKAATPDIAELEVKFNEYLNHFRYLYRWIQIGEGVLETLAPFLGIETPEGDSAAYAMWLHLVRQIGVRDYQIYKLVRVSRAIDQRLGRGQSPHTRGNLRAAQFCSNWTGQILRQVDQDPYMTGVPQSDWFYEDMRKEDLYEVKAWESMGPSEWAGFPIRVWLNTGEFR